MKYLRINNNCGEFYKDGNYISVTEITKDDLLNFINLAFDSDFKMDVVDDNNIKNPAEKIIYSQLYKKFLEIIENKENIREEINHLYEDAFEAYK